MTDASYNTFPMWDAALPLAQRVSDLISRLTLDEKISLMPTRMEAVPRLGITEYWVGGEAAHGLVMGDVPTTVFPQTIGLSSTWNAKLLHEIGSVIGDEARAYYQKRGGMGGLTVWAPTVDMERDPRWGRTEEAYGEDPCLTGTLATALIRGMQGDHPFYIKLAPALKHFYGNNNEQSRTSSSSSIDPRNRREYYLKAYEKAVTEGRVHSLMTAYNEINGTPAIAHPDINNVLKDEWKLDGFVVCDGADMHQTVTEHHYCQTYAEAVALAIKGGIDCVTDDAELVKDSVREALEQGLLAESDLDAALQRVFRIRMRLGQFDPDSLNPYSQIPVTAMHRPEHQTLALQAAREAVVLLKNNGLLPLNAAELKQVALLGPLADVVYRDWYTGHAPYVVTPLQGIVQHLAPTTVLYEDGSDQVAFQCPETGLFVTNKQWHDGTLVAQKNQPSSTAAYLRTDWGWGANTFRSVYNNQFWTANDDSGHLAASAPQVWGWFVKELFQVKEDDGTAMIRTWNGRSVVLDSETAELRIAGPDVAPAPFRLIPLRDGVAEAVRVAKSADVAIVFAGNHPLINGKEEIDRPGLTLPAEQERLIRAVHAANPRTVLVIVGSYPFALGELAEELPAIVYTAHGAQELGNALAEILVGASNPAGRLSLTWYASEHDLPDIMEYDIIKGQRTYQYFAGQPLYPFGHGLSYTSFEYSDLKIDAQPCTPEQPLQLSLRVTNTGKYAGDEVVQCYVRVEGSRVKRPGKQLVGFERVHLQAGESKTMTWSVRHQDLAFWDVTRERYCVEDAKYTVLVGTSSADIRLTAPFEVAGEEIPPRDPYVVIRAENYNGYHNLHLTEGEEKQAVITPKAASGWAAYTDMAFAEGASQFRGRARGKGGLTLHLDDPSGPLIGKTETTGESWQDIALPISIAPGRHQVYLALAGDIQLSSLQFVAGIGQA